MTSTPFTTTNSHIRLTDNGGGTAASALAAGVGVYNLTIPCMLLKDLGTSAIDVVTGLVLGHRFKLLAFDFFTYVAGTGTSASQVFNLEIGSTNTTGGALTVTLASTSAIGELTEGTAFTAANTGSATDAISIELAASGTAFTAGEGHFVLKVQNLDTADAFASLAALPNMTSTV